MKFRITIQFTTRVFLISAMSASAGIRYVDANSASPVAPYTSWATAATTIQDAVDAAFAGDQILVTNGVYQAGGRKLYEIMNRVAVNKPVTVQSVNGAASTLIQGDHIMRCVYLTNGAALVGFTLTNGIADYGAGAWCESASAVLSNCMLIGNSATGEGGGGAAGVTGCTLNNCSLSGNTAVTRGGGAFNCTLNNCTVTGNLANLGGGASYCTLNNCLVYYNRAERGDNYADSVLSYSCTTPLPLAGVGNISADPVLTDLSHVGSDSPCRGAGSPAYSTGLDIDGEVWANLPSIGCDEYGSGVVTEPLNVAIRATDTNVVPGFQVNFTAVIGGRATANQWEFGDGIMLSNRPYASHSWAVAGDYTVTLQASNDAYPDGVKATVTVHVVAQPVHFVAPGSTNPIAPYTSWSTAANNIQDAVDAASVAGALVRVTNGVYQTGGRAVFGAMTNRVAVNKSITVQSVNGEAVTVIRGYQVPGTTNGDGAIRCVYLTRRAALVGFTLSNGATRGAGASQEQFGGGVWCESISAVVSNCILTGNSATQGGGANSGTLNNCTVLGNSAGYGGAMFESTLNNCRLISNSSNYGGGGAGGILNNCLLTGNSALYEGGGSLNGTLNNCTLNGNSAEVGGGVAGSTLNNCIVYYNSARVGDNYSSESSFSHSCTTPLASGVGNISDEPQLADTFHLSAGSPCRGAGSTAYDIGLDIEGQAWANPPSIGCDEYLSGAVTGPLSVSIQAAYTTVTVGFAANFTAAISGPATAHRWEFGDGAVRNNRQQASHSWAMPGDYTVVLQAYNDSFPGGVSATITVHVVAQPVHFVALGSANPVAPYTSWGTAANNIQDAVDGASVAGALVLVNDGIYETGGRAVLGTTTNRVAVNKPVTIQSVNGAALTLIQGSRIMRCVYLTDGAALVGFTLTNGIADNGGGVRCESTSAVVSNCVLSGNSIYDGGKGGGANGGTLFNCTLSANVSTNISSYGGGAYGATLNDCKVTGNFATFGGGAESCILNNSTLSDNSAWKWGGGVNGGTLNNCTLIDNFTVPSSYSGFGGGASGALLNNCTLTGNSAFVGGGTSGGILNNCTLTGNSAFVGGGTADGTLKNCIVYYNSAPYGENYSKDVSLDPQVSSMSYSCTTPLPPEGMGNLTNPPVFVDYAGGNLRLQSNSPCINAGSNASAPVGPDLDGNPRVVGGTADIGAYEFQSPQSLISYAWLRQYGFPTDGSADNSDPDADGLNNWQEWHTGTNPTNALSVLHLLTPSPGPQGLVLAWQSVTGLVYFLERATNLEGTFLPLATNIVGQPSMTSFTDTNSFGTGPFFYRIGVQNLTEK